MDDPEPDPNTAIFIITYCLALLICFAVTMGISALKEVNEKKVRDAAENGDKVSKRLARLIDRRPRPSDISAVCTALCSMLAVSSALLCFWPRVADKGLLIDSYSGIKSWLLAVILPAVLTVLISAAVFAAVGIVMPRRLGKQDPEKYASSLSGFISFITVIFTPLTWPVSAVAGVLVKVFGGDPHVDEAPVTEDEILSMVDEGEETGVLEEIEKEMINNIFEFGELTAGEVMTHRTYLTAAEMNEDISQVVEKAIDAGCSRLPVYKDELDDIKGILYVKDLLKYVGTEIPKELKPSDLMREAMFIPETKKCRDLFTEMTEKHLQMVIVSDEYGGVAGIVTIEDLIESIVGNIQDEFDDEDEEIEQISEDIFNIDGASDIREVEELLNITFPEGEYDTVAGYLMSVLGRIPDADEHPTVEYGGFSFTVSEMDERRIVRIRAERLPEPIEDSKPDTEEEDED